MKTAKKAKTASWQDDRRAFKDATDHLMAAIHCVAAHWPEDARPNSAWPDRLGCPWALLADMRSWAGDVANWAEAEDLDTGGGAELTGEALVARLREKGAM